MRVVNSTESNLYSIFFCGLKNLNEELKLNYGHESVLKGFPMERKLLLN